METFGEQVVDFYKKLNATFYVADGVDVMKPYNNPQIASYAEQFYRKYYNDNIPRTFIISINPRKYGGGITGVPLTDAVKLEINCGIANHLPKMTDSSSEFMYSVIENYGGVDAFYKKFYVTDLSPLGFVSHGGSTVNYYDSKTLSNVLPPLMAEWLKTQLNFGSERGRCICLGAYDNLDYLKRLNNQYNFFNRIDVLEHPQYIMEKHGVMANQFVEQYIDVLNQK
jgi:hypothetical protein